jgi:hypothetical protein
VFVLFSANAGDADLLVMPPSAYLTAFRQMLSLDFSGLGRIFFQLANWLTGPSESYAMAPINAVGVAILAYVVCRGRQFDPPFDPWLRLLGAAALAQHAVALFYNAAAGRYHYLSWFLTMLVGMVFMQQVGMDWLQRRYPVLSERVISNPVSRWLASGLSRLQKVSL